MNVKQRAFGLMQAFAVVLALALPLIVAVSPADARIGSGISSGSRGARTFSAPPSTSTAPSATQPFNRTASQPGSPGFGTGGGGFFNRPGMGLFGNRHMLSATRSPRLSSLLSAPKPRGRRIPPPRRHQTRVTTGYQTSDQSP